MNANIKRVTRIISQEPIEGQCDPATATGWYRCQVEYTDGSQETLYQIRYRGSVAHIQKTDPFPEDEAPFEGAAEG